MAKNGHSMVHWQWIWNWTILNRQGIFATKCFLDENSLRFFLKKGRKPAFKASQLLTQKNVFDEGVFCSEDSLRSSSSFLFLVGKWRFWKMREANFRYKTVSSTKIDENLQFIEDRLFLRAALGDSGSYFFWSECAICSLNKYSCSCWYNLWCWKWILEKLASAEELLHRGAITPRRREL